MRDVLLTMVFTIHILYVDVIPELPSFAFISSVLQILVSSLSILTMPLYHQSVFAVPVGSRALNRLSEHPLGVFTPIN